MATGNVQPLPVGLVYTALVVPYCIVSLATGNKLPPSDRSGYYDLSTATMRTDTSTHDSHPVETGRLTSKNVSYAANASFSIGLAAPNETKLVLCGKTKGRNSTNSAGATFSLDELLPKGDYSSSQNVSRSDWPTKDSGRLTLQGKTALPDSVDILWNESNEQINNTISQLGPEMTLNSLHESPETFPAETASAADKLSSLRVNDTTNTAFAFQTTSAPSYYRDTPTNSPVVPLESIIFSDKHRSQAATNQAEFPHRFNTNDGGNTGPQGQAHVPTLAGQEQPQPQHGTSRASAIGRRVTSLLDSLLLGYDKRLRPDFGRIPLTVKADIEIRSMGPISEKYMIYSMDCYFRQVWVDRRLAFNATGEQVSNVSLNVKMLERIWHPDTYFINGGPSYVHTITTPNKFIRLSHDGTILYSQRLTIKANCPMHLEKFPMDSQLCPLYIASFGYPASDVLYEWHYGNALAAVAATDMRLSQFDLKGMPASNTTKSFKGSPHSILTVFFDFRRHTGFFLIQVYLPCCLLVILSWVSFWINREATSDRISLGATTMLTMTFLVLDTRNDLPRVAYSTALDVYVALCFFFVFASIVQFAAVHFFTKYGTADNDLKTTLLLDSDSEDGDDIDADDTEDENTFTGTGNQANFRQANGHMELRPDSLTACVRKMWSCLLSTRFKKNVRNAIGLNSVSKIDRLSRILFPAAFLGLNIVYWISYW